MKAIIFAAGKGTRFGKLTKKIPKPLIKLNNKPILERVFLELPDEINEIIVIIGYLSNKIKKYFGDNFRGKPITYIEQKELKGTMHALLQIKLLIKINERFLVLMGDDIYSKKDIKKLLKFPLSFGVYKSKPINIYFYNIKLNKNKTIKGFEKINGLNSKKEILMGTNAFVLDKKIFRYKPVKIKNGEYGLPQTIFKMAKKYPIKSVLMEFWHPINDLKNLKKVKSIISKKTDKI